ncbi:MAG: hypothetical protein GXP62_05020, partial [Oligoflexia bacterium]|nr:hypothetical protein [Oligoflexia bacterium]
PHCPGDDINALLAASLDADPVLATAIDQLNALPWPAPALSGVSQPVLALTGDAGFVQLAPVARALWASHLEDRSDDLDRKVAPLDDAVAAGDADALKQAQVARQAYEDALAADGQVLIAQLQASLARAAKKGGADIGLCLNPQALMGCPGSDHTAELLPLLQADRKLNRALSALP